MSVEVGSLGVHSQLDNPEKENEWETRPGGDGADTAIRRHRRTETPRRWRRIQNGYMEAES